MAKFITVALVLATFCGCKAPKDERLQVAPIVQQELAPAVLENIVVQVRRLNPSEAVAIWPPHEDPYINAEFLVISAGEFNGRRFHLRITPDGSDGLFVSTEFFLRIPRIAILERNYERKNPDGSVTVEAFTMSIWNFLGIVVSDQKEANQALEHNGYVRHASCEARVTPAIAVAHL